MRAASACLLALTIGCTAPPIELSVAVRTDLAPGSDFILAEVELLPGQGAAFEPQSASARRSDPFWDGVPVAHFAGVPAGSNRVRATLLDSRGEPVVSRNVDLVLDASYALTLVLSADCAGRTCPGTSEPASYTECLSGRCVEPRCAGLDPAGCGDLTCTTQEDCALDCLAACIEGACVCITTRDAGPPPDGGLDAGPYDAGPCPGECAPGATDDETQSCGCSGGGIQTRTRTCGSDCRWGAFGAFGACSTGGECMAGDSETRTTGCGSCGSKPQTRTCGTDCTWGAWTDTGSCAGEGVCAPGQTESRSVGCGNCGSQAQTRTCSGSCAWEGWTNSGTCGGQGACAPGATRAGGCDGCSHQVCNGSCNWGGCTLRPGNACNHEGGTNFRCCGAGRSQFCLPSCQWSTDCSTACSCGC